MVCPHERPFPLFRELIVIVVVVVVVIAAVVEVVVAVLLFKALTFFFLGRFFLDVFHCTVRHLKLYPVLRLCERLFIKFKASSVPIYLVRRQCTY